jgi:hypothetical protein
LTMIVIKLMNKWQAPTDSNFKEESTKGFYISI